MIRRRKKGAIYKGYFSLIHLPLPTNPLYMSEKRWWKQSKPLQSPYFTQNWTLESRRDERSWNKRNYFADQTCTCILFFAKNFEKEVKTKKEQSDNLPSEASFSEAETLDPSIFEHAPRSLSHNTMKRWQNETFNKTKTVDDVHVWM